MDPPPPWRVLRTLPSTVSGNMAGWRTLGQTGGPTGGRKLVAETQVGCEGCQKQSEGIGIGAPRKKGVDVGLWSKLLPGWGREEGGTGRKIALPLMKDSAMPSISKSAKCKSERWTFCVKMGH